jgi:hypothetical protein
MGRRGGAARARARRGGGRRRARAWGRARLARSQRRANPRQPPAPRRPRAPQKIDGNADQAAHFPLNTRAVDLETSIFKGRLLLSVRGTPTSKAASAPGGPLSCSRRTFHVAVQGRFKVRAAPRRALPP